MQYTESNLALAVLHDGLPFPLVIARYTPTLTIDLPSGTLTLPLQSLPALFTAIPDPRTARGRRFALVSLLSATLAALLCNHLSQLAAAQWLADLSPAAQAALGFRPGHTPHPSTFNRTLRRLDPAALATALHAFFDPPPPTPRPRGSQGVACDGKAQCGRFHYSPLVPGTASVHEISAFCAELGVVLAACAVSGCEEKAAAELNSAPALLAQVHWAGRVLTGDALWCQRNLCAQVVAAGGDYLLTVKANQGHLLDQVHAWFAPHAPRRYGFADPPTDHRETATRDDGHGRCEIRYLCATAELAALLDWPHVAQVFMVIRSWARKGEVKQEIHWGITSLPAGVADVERLLELRRGHWRIENSLHYIKDQTLREDASPIHKGEGPAIMSVLRDMVVSLVHQAGYQQVAARLRHYSRHPLEALTLLGLPLPENA